MCDLKSFLAGKHHSLQHLMWTDVSLEVARVPQFAYQLSKPLHQKEEPIARWSFLGQLQVVFLPQEVGSQWWHMGKCLKDDVAVVVGFDVVETNNSCNVQHSSPASGLNSEVLLWCALLVDYFPNVLSDKCVHTWQVGCSIKGARNFPVLVHLFCLVLSEGWVQDVLQYPTAHNTSSWFIFQISAPHGQWQSM